MNWNLQKLANKIKFDDVQKEIDYRTVKKTLDALIMYCDEEDCSTFVSMESIKQQIRCNSMQTVYNHFEKLQDLGLLEVHKKGRYMMKKIIIKDSNEPSILSSNEPSILSSNEPSNKPSSPLEAKGSKVREDKEEINAPFHFASLSDLIKELKTTKDLKDHKPIKATKELDDYLNSFEYQTVEDKEIVDYVLDIGYCFIKYRDYMYKETKENKYKIKTFASVKQFINAVSNNYSHIDLETLFDKLESRGWATIEKGYKI